MWEGMKVCLVDVCGEAIFSKIEPFVSGKEFSLIKI